MRPTSGLASRSRSSRSGSGTGASTPQPPAFCQTAAPSACFATAADCAAAYQRLGFEIQVFKIGKRNRRLVPGLSECRLLDQAHSRSRKVPGRSPSFPIHPIHSFNLSSSFSSNSKFPKHQVGEQDLALGFKFNAKGENSFFFAILGAALYFTPRIFSFPPVGSQMTRLQWLL